MTQLYELPFQVYKAYDIRGIVPAELNTTFALLLGRALAMRAIKLGIQQAVIGYDGRHSSPELAAALAEGMRTEGINTLDIGMVPTPMVYYQAAEHRIGLAVAITGSHNPPAYNGFKIMLDGRAIHGAEILSLYSDMQALISNHSAAEPDNSAVGTTVSRDVIEEYIQRIVGDVKLTRPMKIVLDCGNGVGAVAATELFKRLGCAVDELYCEVDGDFPNHHPDPADPNNLQDIIEHLKNSDCELGLAFDGDADRLGVVTKSGQIIWPDRQLILFLRDVLERVPGATIIYDVKCSRHVGESIKAAGGVPLMWKTGHSLVKAKMAEIDCPLAGEMSGHIFFKERWYGFDDGLYAGARLLEILSKVEDPNATLEALPQDLSTPELKLPMQEGEPHALIERLQTEAVFPTAQSTNKIDGVRAEYADGFGLARASNTTPVVVLRFEAQNDEALNRIKAEFREAILKLAPESELPF
ncbi:MAG: phosphomannomutase/phosphoglucomutase [Alcaligenaceae bacterium]|nr:phosphomannomutase/phosphoglucomutase [Alcaligenaceae bacterium]